MNSKLKLIRKCEWEEVFLTWYKNEGEDAHWQALAHERGYASWADWRLNGYARPFECEKADWTFYELSNAGQEISTWNGGSFKTWVEKYYQGEKTRTFAQLAEMAEIIENGKIKSMIENYPVKSIISALELPDGKIYVIEGTHRACALALMLKNKLALPEKIIVAIGKSSLAELPVVGQSSIS